MIHLFNKIHLKGDHQVKYERDRIVISPMYGSLGVIDNSFVTMANDRKQGKVWYSATSYQQLIDTHFDNNENNFFTFLINYDPTKRLTLYVDIPTMLYILTKFYKTVLPKLDTETYGKLIKLIFLRINYIYGVGFLPFVKLPENIARDYRVQSMNVIDNITNIIQAWNSVTPWKITRDLRDKIVSNVSVEFQLAAYFAGINTSNTSKFKEKTVRMVKKQVIHDFVLDIKHTLLASFVNFDVLEPTANFDPFVDSLETFVTKFPKYKFLTDDKFTPENVDYVYRTYDMSELQQVANNVDKFLMYDVDPRIIKLLINTPTFEYLVNDDLLTNGHYTYNIGEYQESINCYIIDFVIDLYKKNQLDVLRQLAIG